MKKIRHSFWYIILLLATAAAIVAIIMLLWNWLIPSIFGFSTISYWQAAGIFILTRILFGGWGKPFNNKSPFNHSNRMHEKWMNMTEKEREEFINRRRKHFFHKHYSSRQGFSKEDERDGNNEKNGNNE